MENTCDVRFTKFLITEDDCNCACPVDAAPETAFAPAALEGCRPAAGLRGYALEDGWTALYQPARAQVTALNPAALRLLGSFALPAPARARAQAGLRGAAEAAQALAQRGLLAVDSAPALAPAPPQTLAAWLHLTGACNLRCRYCYVDHHAPRMTPATARAALEQLFHSALRHGFSAVKLKYAGGEPALAFGLVRQIHAHAAALAQHCGLRLHEVLLSNGTLLDAGKLEFLRESGIGLMLSLDGLAEPNDAQRVTPTGGGTFAAVDQAVRRAATAGLTPQLSITATARNAGQLAGVVRYALERELPFHINFYRPAPGTKQDPLMPEPQALIAGVREAFAVVRQNLPRLSLLGCLDLANLASAHQSACGAGHNYVVVLPDGRVTFCHMQPGSAQQAAGADLLEQANRQAGLGALPPECAGCDWRYACAGGCPALGQTGANPYCAVYRALLPELVQLEGLRLARRGA